MSHIQTVERKVDILKEGGQHLTVSEPVDAVHELKQFCLSLSNWPDHVCDDAKNNSL